MAKKLSFVVYRDSGTGHIAAKLKSGDQIPTIPGSDRWKLEYEQDYLRLQLIAYDPWVLYIYKTHISFPNMGFGERDIDIFVSVMKRVFPRCSVDAQYYQLERDMAEL